MSKPATASRLTLVKLTARCATLLVAVWLAGFLWFWLALPEAQAPEDAPVADAVVVLTGGDGRLDAGLALLAAQKGERMLISGVHQSVSYRDLSALTGAPMTIFECCIDLDHVSDSTKENAVQSAAWATGKGYSSLLIVTADYHMSRSLAQFRLAMPDKAIIPFPVASKISMQGLVTEYSKLLVTKSRHLFAS